MLRRDFTTRFCLVVFGFILGITPASFRISKKVQIKIDLLKTRDDFNKVKYKDDEVFRRKALKYLKLKNKMKFGL